jgi:hypothetical protein
MIETMIETKHIIAELSVTEKICLYNALYEDLAGKGIEGDTELAHVNKEEMVVLRDMGGSGTINPNTGLIQFMGGGSPPPPPPASQTVSQTSEFPTELKPFVSDVLGKAQAIQEKRETEGYIPYEGPQVAGFTPEQEQAFSGIQGLVGQGQQYFDPSTQLAASASRTPTGAEISSYMSPYVQQVVDIQKREALRQGDVAQQGLAAQAVGAGGYGGSRMAILEAEQNRNLQQQLGDIQTRGIAAAYEDAQARLAQQRQRELAGSSQFAQLGQVAPQQALKELTAVEAVGAQRQAQTQQGLNIAKQQFEEEQIFPEQTLQQYQSVIRGFPLAPSTYRQTQTTTPAPSYLQQAAGLGAAGIGLAGAFGGFGKAQGGLVNRMRGGQVDQNSGLGSIVVKRFAGQQVAPAGVVPPQTPMIGSISKAPISLSTEAINKAVAEGRITRREAMLARQKLMEEGAKPTADDTAYLNKLRGVDFDAQKKETESEYTKDLESVKSNKYLALAKAGFGVLGQDGTKGTLGGISAGVTSSGALDDLSKLAKEERQLAKDKRKELKGISSDELNNMASVAGISRKEADAMRDAQINAQNDIISEANTGIKEMTALAGLQKSDRQEYVAEQKILLDYNAAIKKAGKEGGMKAADYNAVLKSVLDSYGAVVNKDEYGKVSIMIGNKALSGDLLKKINADKDKAVNAWIDAGGGNKGFRAVTNIFQKPKTTTDTADNAKPRYKIVDGKMVLVKP